jgi:hypothetical protein
VLSFDEFQTELPKFEMMTPNNRQQHEFETGSFAKQNS